MKNIKNCVMMALVWAAASVPLGYAATGIDVGDKVGSPGATVEVAITLEATEEAVAGIQFDLSFDGSQLTSQPAIVGSAQGGDVATRSRETQVGRRRVLVYSTTASPLSEGQVVRIPFTINDDTPFDDYALTLIESAAILAKQDATAFEDPSLSNGLITVQDAPPTVQISGTVRYYGGDNEPIRSVELIIAGDVNQTVNANDVGAYSVEVDTGSSVSLIPLRAGNDIVTQGVNVADVVAIRNHILGRAGLTLTDGASVLAADANRSEGVDVGDVVSIRNVILGRQNFFSGSVGDPDPVFRFFSASLIFDNPATPWVDLGADDVNAARQFDGVGSDFGSQDFLGVKLGDANGDWVEPAGGDPATLSLASRSSASDLDSGNYVEIGSAFVAPGESVAVPVYIRTQEPILAVQFTVNWDHSALQFRGIENLSLTGLNAESHLNLDQVSEGALSLAWDDPALLGIGADSSEPALNLLFDPVNANANGSAIQLASSPTALVAANANGALDLSGLGGYVVFHGDASANEGFGPYPVAVADNGDFTIWYPTQAGALYAFETTSDLGSGEWIEVETFTGTGQLATLSSDSDGGGQGFFRFRRIDSVDQ